MKKGFLIMTLVATMYSCGSGWEYKTVTVKGKPDKTMADFEGNTFDVSGESLNLFGKDGWELVGIYENTETVHPNFGNDQYVSGLQPNVRTAEINLIFKRQK